MRIRVMLLVAFVSICSSRPAVAQNWSFDARAIGMGGVGGTDNLASKMIDEQRPYRSIVLPFGLIQVLGDRDVFDPNSSHFDPVRAIEYAISPIHYVVGRDKGDTGSLFVTDVRNATLSRDLNRYRGFVPPNEIVAEGLASPNWGGTIKFAKGAGGAFQGVYIGGGPYLSMRNNATIDKGLTDLLASTTPVFRPNAQFPITNTSQGQLALAVTGGYRGRFAWPSGVGSGTENEGLYVAVNYNHLIGFHYDDIGLLVRFDTDQQGLVTVNPTAGPPVFIDRRMSTKGTGHAVDVGIGVVVGPWEAGFGVRGIANKMDWRDVERTTFSLGSLTSGNKDFLESATTRVGDASVELPVDYRGNLGYRTDRWAAAAEVGQGFQGTSFHSGLEQKFERIELRGGVRYTTKRWNPTGGLGFNLSPRFSLDVAAYGTTANIERKRHVAIAASMRFNHGKK